MATTKPPAGLKPRGRRLWTWLVGEFEPEPHELVQVLEACRIVDRLDALARVIETDGVTAVNAKGDTVAHPALVEARQQVAALNRTLATLNIPAPTGTNEWDGLSASQRARKAALRRHHGGPSA